MSSATACAFGSHKQNCLPGCLGLGSIAAMKAVIAALSIGLTLATPVEAKDFLKDLSRKLDKFGESLGRTLTEPGPNKQGNANVPAEPFSGQPNDQRTGDCLLYDERVALFHEERCTAKTVCVSDRACSISYRLLSDRNDFVEEWHDGRPVRFLGLPAEAVTVDGLGCVARQDRHLTFCFRDDRMLSGTYSPFAPHANIPDETSEKARLEAEMRARDVERVEAERKRVEEQSKIEAIAVLTGPADVERFFRGRTIEYLPAIDAAAKCEDDLMERAKSVAIPVPLPALAGIRSRCAVGAHEYGKGEVERVADEQIAKVLAWPATPESLREHSWFNLMSQPLEPFLSIQRTSFIERYEAGISNHRAKAIAAMQSEVERLYKMAEPLGPTSDGARESCILPGDAPAELLEFCRKQNEELDTRTRDARCNRAIKESGASDRLLDMPMSAFGQGYEQWQLRRIICAGVTNHPDFQFSVGNGYIPWLTTPYLQVRSKNGATVFEVELRVQSAHSDRSFSKILLDIATGANEENVPERLVVDRIVRVAPGPEKVTSENIIGCMLGIVNCT